MGKTEASETTPAAAGGGGQASSSDIEFYELIKAADTLIADSRLGMYGNFIAPFTRQFKMGLRDAFAVDTAVFDMTDSRERAAIHAALQMRAITFAVFLMFSAGLAGVVWYALGLGEAGLARAWEAFAVFAAGAGAAYAIRWAVRHEYLSSIGSDATLFANYFFKELTNIHDRAINAVRSSNSDLMLSSAWPERSAGWIKIALWYGKRYENLDRYVTATAWRVESRYRIIERTFVILKLIVLTAVSAGVLYAGIRAYSHTGSAMIIPVIGALGVYVAATAAWWGVFRRVSNAFWAERFRVSIVGFDEQKEHIYNQVAKVVAGDKKMLMSDKRNVGERKNS